MKTVISAYQTTLLLILVIVATTIFSLPSILIVKSGRDAWISLIILIFYGIFLSFLYTPLCKRMGRVDLINYSRQVLGPMITIPVGLIIIIAFLLMTGLVIRQTGEVLITSYMMRTPLWFFNITILLTIALLVFYGLEVIARSFELLFYIYSFLFLITFLFLFNELSPDQLYPILNTDLRTLFSATYPCLFYFSPLFIILIIAPQITEQGKILKPLTYGVLFSGFFLILPVLYSLLIFGPDLSAEFTIPIININSYIEKFMIIERVDPFFVFYWVGGGVFKAAIFFYAATYISQKMFGFSTPYVFIPLFLWPIFYFSFNFIQDLEELSSIIFKTTPFLLITMVFFPLLLLLVGLYKGVNYSDKKT